MSDTDFHYGAELERAFQRCPPLRSVEPQGLRIFLAGFITAQEMMIADLRTQLDSLRQRPPGA